MKKLVDVLTMRNSDSKKIEEVGSTNLMFEAGKKLFESYDYKGNIGIVCGSGNNAGDGYVLAHFLPNAKILRITEKISNDALFFFKDLKNEVIFIDEKYDFSNYDIIVDCIFGTGFNKKVDEPYKSIIKNINKSKAFKISCDIPSGLNGNTGLASIVLKADLTVSIGFLKYGLFLNDAKNYTGKIINNNIGINLFGDCGYLIESNDIKEIFKKRNENSNKKSFGYTAIIGGSLEYSGAIKLSNLSYSALRSGCGIAKLYVPKSITDSLKPYMLESILVGIDDTNGYMNYTDDFKNLTNMDSICIGMGWGYSDSYKDILNFILTNYKCPIIIDADGLNTLNKMDQSILGENVVITPHLKEFSRLINKEISDIKEHLVEYSFNYAKEHNNCTVLLKGPSTIITNGKVIYVVDKGTVGMSTAGSGDVLSGILSGILAYSNLDLPLSVAAGAFVNGLAGELGLEDVTEISLMARDTIINIPKAIKSIKES
ncbi:MAG: NAD(P)H-hydrate dehydratase [Acholeplasmatales bacterium]|nr:NAD(P)H-hydrate dehydratase [Acholeplasmatales bacterium]